MQTVDINKFMLINLINDENKASLYYKCVFMAAKFDHLNEEGIINYSVF